MSVNIATFSGRLGAAPEFKTLENGTELLNFSIANNVGWGEREKTQWIACTLFGVRAGKLAPHLEKGKMVVVSGEVDLEVFTDRQGNPSGKLRVKCSEIELMDSGQPQQQQQGQAPQGQQQPTYQQQPQTPPPSNPNNMFGTGGAPSTMPDDVPF